MVINVNAIAYPTWTLCHVRYIRRYAI